MNNTILVPLDTSSWSEHALPMAAMLAQSSGASLHLVHVYVPILFVDAGGYGIGGIPVLATCFIRTGRLVREHSPEH